MSGTHDILAAERAAAAAKKSNQGTWEGRSEGQIPSGAPITTDKVRDKDASSGIGSNRTTAQDTMSGATSSDISGSGISSSKEIPGRQRENLYGSQLDENQL
ncbi:hypothetical protein C0991_005292 [Blastosporella zonata]|nr:hypothetical protein C0991_005292 [Blastosporella zonata]